MVTINDVHDKALSKEDIDTLFWELNKELRKKLRKVERCHKAELYVVGGACVVTTLCSRMSTNDVDAVWTSGADMKDCIDSVADKFDLGHTWCNSLFKNTKSYTDKLFVNSYIYREYDRLVVRMVNLDLLLAMKLIAFREHKRTDMLDCVTIINSITQNGVACDMEFMTSIILKYYGTLDVLSKEAKNFIGIGV